MTHWRRNFENWTRIIFFIAFLYHCYFWSKCWEKGDVVLSSTRADCYHKWKNKRDVGLMILSLGLHHTGNLTTSVKLNRHRRACMEARFHPHIQHQDVRSRPKRPTDILLFSSLKNTEVVSEYRSTLPWSSIDNFVSAIQECGSIKYQKRLRLQVMYSLLNDIRPNNMYAYMCARIGL